MILVDANLLLYAEDSRSGHHELARKWWDQQLSGSTPVCLCWPVLTAFLRIGTNARLHQRPLSLREATQRVQSWVDQPCVRIIEATENHWPIFQRMLKAGNAAGNLVMDAHLAALAVEHACRLCSSDSDFARFPGIKWLNPVGIES